MSLKTDYLDLVKPTYDDLVDIEVINQNMDIIDESVKLNIDLINQILIGNSYNFHQTRTKWGVLT